MKLLWLKEIIGDAYTEDMDAAACQAIGKDFVARADFNAKNTRVKELEAQVGQLEEAAKVTLDSGGTRFVYSLQPMSEQVWWIDFNEKGEVVSRQNVLDREHFALIRP